MAAFIQTFELSKRRNVSIECLPTYTVGVRRDAEFFEEAELDLIYMARKLRDALKLEALLNGLGIEYLVETGTYTGGFLMKRDLTSAFFYVIPADVERARHAMLANGFRPYQPD